MRFPQALENNKVDGKASAKSGQYKCANDAAGDDDQRYATAKHRYRECGCGWWHECERATNSEKKRGAIHGKPTAVGPMLSKSRGECSRVARVRYKKPLQKSKCTIQGTTSVDGGSPKTSRRQEELK